MSVLYNIFTGSRSHPLLCYRHTYVCPLTRSLRRPFAGLSGHFDHRRTCACRYIYHIRQGYIIVVVCLFVGLLATLSKNFPTDSHEISREGWQWATKKLILVAIRIAVWIHGLFSGFITVGRYGKWLTCINLLLILIRQMAALVRCALAEVCIVPVLRVLFLFSYIKTRT